MRRPLFLRPAGSARVDLDGPALRVRAERKEETRFPLDRMSRIVAGARVNFSAEAICACLEHAIPIVIVNKDGTALGSVQPARIAPLPLARALEELLDWPDWRDIYGCWLRAARMRVVADRRRAREAEGKAPDPRAYQELVRKHLYPAAAASGYQTMTGLWRGAVYALAAEATVRWGVPGVMHGDGGDVLDLRRDLAQLMELRLRLEVREEAEGSLKGEAAMLLVFHAFTKKLEAEVARAMRSLARRVKEVVSGCR
jgi:hypothetical protein